MLYIKATITIGTHTYAFLKNKSKYLEVLYQENDKMLMKVFRDLNKWRPK